MSASASLPPEHSRFATRFGLEGRTFEVGNYPVAQIRWIKPGYFATLGIPLRSGRWLMESDAAPGRILINETLARRFFPNRDPVGRHLVLGERWDTAPMVYTSRRGYP